MGTPAGTVIAVKKNLDRNFLEVNIIARVAHTHHTQKGDYHEQNTLRDPS